MIAPLLLTIGSIAGILCALFIPGWSDLVLIAAPMAVGSLYLLIRATLARPKTPAKAEGKAPPPPAPEPQAPRTPLPGWRIVRKLRPAPPPPKWIVVDGSNVLYWQDNTPNIATVKTVVKTLKARGLSPMVVFDANAGYLTAGKYQHDFAFGRALGLPEVQVMVVEKGTPADPAVLDLARGLEAQIVSNDRYRDWAEAYPEVKRHDLRVTGRFEEGRLMLDMAG